MQKVGQQELMNVASIMYEVLALHRVHYPVGTGVSDIGCYAVADLLFVHLSSTSPWTLDAAHISFQYSRPAEQAEAVLGKDTVSLCFVDPKSIIDSLRLVHKEVAERKVEESDGGVLV